MILIERFDSIPVRRPRKELVLKSSSNNQYMSIEGTTNYYMLLKLQMIATTSSIKTTYPYSLCEFEPPHSTLPLCLSLFVQLSIEL